MGAANILQGKDASFRLFVTDADGHPVDLTGWTMIRLRMAADSGYIEKLAPLTDAVNAQQTVIFAGGPPSAGTFSFGFNGTTSFALAYSSTAVDVQTAFRASSGLRDVTVGGNFNGFIFNFVGADGARVQPAITVANSSLVNGSTALTPSVSYDVVGVPQSGIDVVNISQGALNVYLSEGDTLALTVGTNQDMDLLVRIGSKDLNIPLIKGMINVTENPFV